MSRLSLEATMRRFLIILTSFLVLWCYHGTRADCTKDSAEVFDIINPDNYDRNFSSITSVGKRPLGFKNDIWYFNTPGEANPCVKVTGALGRRVEIRVETVPESRLCVKQEGVAIGCTDSSTGQMYSCRHSTDDLVYIEFYCDSECAEGNVQFWYRIVVGPSLEEDSEDEWCDSQPVDQYPQALQFQSLTFDFPEPTTSQPGDDAPLTRIPSVLLIASIACLTFALRLL